MIDLQEKKVNHEFNASWKREGHVWYIESLSEVCLVPMRDLGEVAHRWDLAYGRFTPNAAVPAKQFEMSALEMPGGTRIIDHRQNVGATERLRYVPVKDAEMEATMNTMVEQLSALPTQRPRAPTEKPVEKDIRWWVFAAINVVALLVILWLWRRRRQVALR
jgi:hypothetical protein